MFVYVGTYTDQPLGRAEGIGIFRFDPESGALSPVDTLAGVSNPSFLALAGDGETLYAGERFLYAVNERRDGMVSAFTRDAGSGALTYLNSQSSAGADPCFVSVDASGRFVLTANYSSGTVAVFPISDDGSLEPASSVVQHEGSSVNEKRQAGPHAHMIAPAPEGRFILASDLGTDHVEVYELNGASGTLLNVGSIALAPGAGPRHFAFGRDGSTLYVLNELDSTLSVFDWNGESGQATHRQTAPTLPNDFDGESTCAHVVVSPDGRFVYGSNRGHDSIAIWSVDAASGEISLVGHESTRGKEPRNFAIDPSGRWLLAANQHSDTIVTFERDMERGTLKPTRSEISTPTPVCIVFAGEV
jgi:6-phosphogluconolactonase